MAVAKKLCLLGDFSVGKTSLIRRYIHNEFSRDYHATVGVQVYEYSDEIDTVQGKISFAQLIWDVEGSKFGRELVASYVLGSAGALIVGDATRHDVIASMTSHARTFVDLLPGRPVVFALNKADLLAEEERPAADELIAAFGGEFLYTSALTGDSVNSLFHAIGRRVLEIGA